MTAKHKEILRKNYETLVTDMNPDRVVIILYSELILSDPDVELIRAERTMTEKNLALLDAIRRNEDKAFYAFKRALHSSEQHHLGNLLKEPAQATQSQNVLIRSQPPQRHVTINIPVQGR